jgi:hypothetical protein
MFNATLKLRGTFAVKDKALMQKMAKGQESGIRARPASEFAVTPVK